MSRYTSKHTGPEIDAAIDRAKAGGSIDMEISGKAPAGYGLGEVCKIVDNFESVTVNGWYAAIGDSAPDDGGWWIGLYATLGSMGNLLAFKNGYIAQKKKYYSTWGPWEWVNPPMQLGVEYRTTERYLGKPVYVKLVDCGTVANGVSVDLGLTNCTGIVSVNCIVRNSPVPNLRKNSLTADYSVTTYVDYYNNSSKSGSITFYCGSAISHPGYAIVKYTKE